MGESDLLIAVDRIEMVLQSVDQNIGQSQKMALKQRAKMMYPSILIVVPKARVELAQAYAH